MPDLPSPRAPFLLAKPGCQSHRRAQSLERTKTSGLSSHEEEVLAEFIQAATSSKYAQDAESHTKPVRVSETQTTPKSAQSATQALYWPYWFQVF